MIVEPSKRCKQIRSSGIRCITIMIRMMMGPMIVRIFRRRLLDRRPTATLVVVILKMDPS